MPFPMTYPCVIDVTFSYITTASSTVCLYQNYVSTMCVLIYCPSAHYCNNTCIIQHNHKCYTQLQDPHPLNTRLSPLPLYHALLNMPAHIAKLAQMLWKMHPVLHGVQNTLHFFRILSLHRYISFIASSALNVHRPHASDNASMPIGMLLRENCKSPCIATFLVGPMT